MDYYEDMCNRELLQAGFNLETLTEEQKYLILEPSEAPENFMCDGEISVAEAKRYWLKRLKNSGLPLDLINKARLMNNI